MTPERWQQIKHVVNAARHADSHTRTKLLQQSCVDDFAMRLGAEALLSVTRKLPEQPLSPDQWQRIEQLFQAALEVTPSQRPAFLQQACDGDEILQHEIESLLVYQNAAGALIGDAVHEAAGLLPNDEKARFTPGTTLNKRYRILGLLGKGGMGEVYRADDLTLQQPVALKFLSERLSRDKSMLARFRREVSMSHRVTHPNVCRVHDLGEVITSAGTLPFLSMEYVDGEDLSSLLRRIGRLPSDKAVEIGQQLCAGLAAAHEAGVLHRDLKPANVMIDGKGRVRITDFGLAGFAEQFTGQEVFAGTPAYMSPEQFAGKEVTTKSDIYALGLVLYEVFTGKRVFEAGSLDELKRMHESTAPTTPSSWVKDIDPLVERVILRCLEKDPARRLTSAKQVADALPGGDPLAAALALGETPSPEMVAAAGSKTGMKPMYAVACLVTILLGVIISAMLNRRLNLVEHTGLNESPEAMASKARTIFTQLGYTDTAADQAQGLQYDQEYLAHLEKNLPAADRQRLLATGKTPAIHFWYRESPAPLNSESRYINPVSLTDPPENVPGMRSLSLDPSGRLLRFGAVPPQVEKNPTPEAVPDWKAPFALAGLDFSQFTSVEPEWAPDPLGPCDVRAAWTGIDPVLPTMPIRIEAAGYHGKLTSFQLLRPYHKAGRVPSPPSRKETMLYIYSLAIWLTIVVMSVWLAWRNTKNGSSDVSGALRLAVPIFFIMLICDALLMQDFTSFLDVNNIILKLRNPVYTAVFFAVNYLALEPFVRRKWPHIVISWNRLLYGGLRNPLVGRDVLVGLLAGILIFLNFKVSGGLNHWLSNNFSLDVIPIAMANTRFTMVFLAVGGHNALVLSFSTCFVIFLIRLGLRRDWLVFAAFILFAAIYNFLTESLLFVPLGILSTAIAVFVLSRFGLLSLVAALWAGSVLRWFPVTTNFSAWYTGTGFFVASVLLVLAGFAFYTSLGGQKVFSGKLLEE